MGEEDEEEDDCDREGEFNEEVDMADDKACCKDPVKSVVNVKGTIDLDDTESTLASPKFNKWCWLKIDWWLWASDNEDADPGIIGDPDEDDDVNDDDSADWKGFNRLIRDRSESELILSESTRLEKAEKVDSGEEDVEEDNEGDEGDDEEDAEEDEISASFTSKESWDGKGDNEPSEDEEEPKDGVNNESLSSSSPFNIIDSKRLALSFSDSLLSPS